MRSSCLLKSSPSPANALDHSSAPSQSNKRKCGSSIPAVADSAGAAVFKPGTNLQISRVRKPNFVNVDSARRTQESGSSAILQSQFRTMAPLRLPKKYQNVSLNSEPVAATITTTKKFNWCCPASAPAASSSGAAGIGNPICSASTQKKSRG